MATHEQKLSKTNEKSEASTSPQSLVSSDQSTEIASQGTANPLDVAPSLFNKALDRRKKNRDALIAWVRESLVEDVDFGRIQIKIKPKNPGEQPRYTLSKPSLWKAGAEKICGMLGVTVEWPDEANLYERLSTTTVENIVIRCHLVNAEGKITSKGFGARSLKQDNDDLNKCIKMAKKSAMIDATLTMGGLSEIFTQDREPGDDLPLEDDEKATGEDGLPIGDDCCPIGKWKGAPWNMVDTGYLEWIIKTINDKPEIVKAAKLELGKRTAPRSQAGDIIDNMEIDVRTVEEHRAELKKVKNLDQLTALCFDMPEDIRKQLEPEIQELETVLYQNQQDQDNGN